MLLYLEDSEDLKVGVTELQEQLGISEEEGVSIKHIAQQATNENGQKITKPKEVSGSCAHVGSVGFMSLRHLSCFPSCRGFSHAVSSWQFFMCTRVCLPRGPLSLCLRSFFL